MTLLDELATLARQTVDEGYYRPTGTLRDAPSLKDALADTQRRVPIIAEVKPASPTRGTLIKGGIDGLIGTYVEQGAAGLSVLTEPKRFHGSLANLRKAVATGLPVIMKDFILDEKQIDCAAHHGAAAVLLISSILARERVQELIEYAHMAEREVLLEVANEREYGHAVTTDADLIGINNRDLQTFEVDLGRTPRIVRSAPKNQPIVALSGYDAPEQVRAHLPYADAFLVGTSLIEGRTTLEALTEARE